MAATIRRRRHLVLAAAVAPIFAALPALAAVGDWDGDAVSPTQTRLWDNGGANPGINWDLDALPPAAVTINFDISGDGKVDMNGLFRSHAGLTFKDWTTYELASGTFGLGSFGGGTLKVGASVSDTYGSVYFADGTKLTAGLDLGPAVASNTILFTHADTGTLRLTGPLSGVGSLSLTRTPGGSNIRGVYYDLANGGYSGTTTINTGTAARLLDAGRTGTGTIALQGGGLDILSDIGGQFVTNKISSVSGTIRADHNYTASPTPPFAPGVLHVLSSPGVPLTVDNPTFIGGTNDASVTFTADNGYNFGVYALKIDNAGGAAVVGSRTVIVNNGNRTTGYAGSTRLTGNNRLNEMVVSAQIGPTGGGTPTFFDLNPVTATGITLNKAGTGVLIIDGVNGGSSTGAKTVTAGVLRFNTAASIGAGPVTLLGGPAPVSSGMGVAYSVPVAGTPIATTGIIAGQSGAFDVDFGGYAAAFAPAIGSVSPPFPVTALRLGSSGAGATFGAVGGFVAGGVGTYYWGGGGGTLTIAAGGPVIPAIAGVTTIEMGTSGTLLPGRVNLARAAVIGAAPPNLVNIRAGTLQVMVAGLIGSGGAMPGITGGTNLGCYSTTLGADGSYGGAPAGTPFNGPGQLLLDATVQAGPGYAYGPGGHFGTTGLTLAGGAIGYTPGGAVPAVVPIPALPGVYGATLASTLYQSLAVPLAPVATNILHFGGEYSTGAVGAGAITPLFFIADNGAVPVALLKSGLDSTLNLTAAGPVNGYTGGTGILGGEVLVNSGPQLGMGAIVIADGGMLHVGAGGPPMVAFPQVLRVANGPSARASRITVDAGITADFSGSPFESSTGAATGSVLEKLGGGLLQFLPGFVYGSTAANTWGLKATAGGIEINQLPGTTTPSNGSAIFDTGTLIMPGTADPGFIVIPAATQFHPNYGFSGLQTYAGTASVLSLGDKAFFRVTGAQTSNLMGTLTVSMGTNSVFKIAGSALGTDTRGTGSVIFAGGNVQFTPGAGKILWPKDGGFSMTMGFGTHFSGCPDADYNGKLTFNDGGSPMCTIDGATVSNVPAPAISTWTIGGTGATSWAGTVIKGQTEAIPGSGGPFVSGTVNINRGRGAPVTLSAGSLLDIEFGTLAAGGTGDPFTDTATAAHLSVVNNANFNITAGTKHVSSIGGGGVTTVSAGATLLVGSTGPVTQGTFTVNGTADVGNVNVTGTTTVGPSPANLDAAYIRGGPLVIGTGTARIKTSGLAGGVSKVSSVSIAAGGHLNLTDNHLIVVGGAATSTWTGAAYDGVAGLVANGYNGGDWAGSGIVTDQSNAISPNVLTQLVTISSDDGGYAGGTFAGLPTASGDQLVMYTWGGDANLDGTLNGDDYFQIDSHFNQDGLIFGYFNGDFNYDGAINGDDYFIIDSNFNAGSTSAPFFVSSGVGPGVTSVPEPAGGAALAIAGFLMFRRRR